VKHLIIIPITALGAALLSLLAYISYVIGYVTLHLGGSNESNPLMCFGFGFAIGIVSVLLGILSFQVGILVMDAVIQRKKFCAVDKNSTI
jgi:zinc transporter ZupT